MKELAGDLNATHLLGLLEKKHHKDVFVPECKNGPTWTSSHLRMDAWAVRKSWTDPCVWGYEIKVNRSDFLRDEKWGRALTYCNQFYFACPSGLIHPEELPAEVGLLWAAKTGTRLFTKRKAPHREPEIPEEIWRYILFWRAKIIPSMQETASDTREYWKAWLARKGEDKNLGWCVSKTLAQKYERDVIAVKQKQKELDEALIRYRRLEQALLDLDISLHDLRSTETIRAKLAEIGMNPSTGEAVDLLQKAIWLLRKRDRFPS